MDGISSHLKPSSSQFFFQLNRAPGGRGGVWPTRKAKTTRVEIGKIFRTKFSPQFRKVGDKEVIQGDISGCPLCFVEFKAKYTEHVLNSTFVLMPTKPREQPDVSPCNCRRRRMRGCDRILFNDPPIVSIRQRVSRLRSRDIAVAILCNSWMTCAKLGFGFFTLEPGILLHTCSTWVIRSVLKLISSTLLFCLRLRFGKVNFYSNVPSSRPVAS